MGNEDFMMGQLIILVGFWGGVLVYPFLQFQAIKRMRNGWRVLAYLPLIVMVLVFAVTVVGFIQQSNLWPIVLIFVSPLVIVYLVGLLVLHALFMRGKSENQKQT